MENFYEDPENPPTPATSTTTATSASTPNTTTSGSSASANSPREDQKPAPRKKQHKLRPFSACIPCRNRKVKCNRLTPCETCINRGIPQDCHYTANDEDRQAMAQAETIGDLRAVVRELRGRLEDEEHPAATARWGWRGPVPAGSGDGQEEEESMLVVYEALQRVGDDGAWRLVAMLRTGASMREVAAVAREYMYMGI